VTVAYKATIHYRNTTATFALTFTGLTGITGMNIRRCDFGCNHLLISLGNSIIQKL